MNRRDLQALSRVRLSEAKALVRLGLPDGAYYLAGYAVECALKACIARATQRHDFPDRKKVVASHTHDLRELVGLVNLEAPLRQAAREDPLFSKSWDLVQSWSEQARYGRYSTESAHALVEAIGNKNHGVIKWVMLYW